MRHPQEPRPRKQCRHLHLHSCTRRPSLKRNCDGWLVLFANGPYQETTGHLHAETQRQVGLSRTGSRGPATRKHQRRGKHDPSLDRQSYASPGKAAPWPWSPRGRRPGCFGRVITRETYRGAHSKTDGYGLRKLPRWFQYVGIKLQLGCPEAVCRLIQRVTRRVSSSGDESKEPDKFISGRCTYCLYKSR